MVESAQYTGQFDTNEVRHGRGMLIFEEPEDYELVGPVNVTKVNDWEMYQGNFAGGAIHGKGMLFLRDGSKLDGDFENNQVKSGILSQANGDMYAGDFDEEGKYVGYSMFSEKSTGNRYTGEFLAGRRHGDGALKYNTGIPGTEKTFTGKWHDD